jgi:transcriptional regulator with XRE-family HTH domain
MEDMYAIARKHLALRIVALSDEQLAEFALKTVGERIRWGVEQLGEISGGLINASKLSDRLGRSRGLLYQLMDDRSKSPTMDVLNLLELEIGLPLWFLMGRMEQRDRGSGPASMLDRLPAHLREDMLLGKNLGTIVEALELAHLVIERNLGADTIREVRKLLEAGPR